MDDLQSAYLLAYFEPETAHDGEQIRFAVSAPGAPTDWVSLNGSAPILRSEVGEAGVRDPFLLWDETRDRFVVIATDLRVYPDDDWVRAVTHGSRNIVVWESPDLLGWSGPALRTVSPPEAGNTWAPKAFWSSERQAWVIVWASALYEDGPRESAVHQRLLAATTTDFRDFSEPWIYLDRGHDVIDATFLSDGERVFRISADAHAPADQHTSHHVSIEVGTALEDPDFHPLVRDVGADVIAQGEGPAVFTSPTGDMSYLLIDEYGLRGYQLFELETARLRTGAWRHIADPGLPRNARHGSVLSISARQRRALLDRWG